MKTLTATLHRETEIPVFVEYEYHPAQAARWDWYGGEPTECEHVTIESVYIAATKNQIDLTEEEYQELEALALQVERN
ncbi:hypothetical protein M0R72_13815 [Candidatus Pacearchaeota archaeon]|jgi:hypothetical protein|nr:hypothetical protein [Candidatus Pacearchaeota archaeon]